MELTVNKLSLERSTQRALPGTLLALSSGINVTIAAAVGEHTI